MRGGKIIGQGTYGCVFNPPLRCRTKKIKPDHLGKISEYSDVRKEIEAARALAKVPYSKYFVLPEISTLCIPIPMNQQVEPDISQCDAIKRLGTSNMVHYQMKFGGTPIKTALRDVNYSFIPLMTQILEIGSVLILNGYVHNDFHMNNILLLPNKEPRLIDFGRSFSAKSINLDMINSNWTDYGPDFPYEPPDMSLAIAVHERVPLQTCIEDIRSKKSSVINIERVLGVSRESQMRELVEFWTTSKSATAADWPAYWTMYWPTIDAWAIGTILLDLLRTRLLSKEFATEWSRRQEVIEGVIKGLLHSSPRKRLDCLEALALINPAHPIVISGRAWLQNRRHT